jgi:hypothetical protein|nr:hypothetical protein [uncultured Granulicatella sp.]
MKNMNRILKEIEKFYYLDSYNIYSQKFFRDLFSGYAFSLNDDNRLEDNFFEIVSTNKKIERIFYSEGKHNFSFNLERQIDDLLLDLANFGKAYIYISEKYDDLNNNTNEKNRTIKIIRLRGILKNNSFYSIRNNKVHRIDIRKESVIIYDLKDLGYKRNYFKKIVNKIGKCDVVSNYNQLANESLDYDFKVHTEKSKELILKALKDVGWFVRADELSDSHLLYKQIQMRMLKERFLEYIIGKINLELKNRFINDVSFEIKPLIRKINYIELWKKYSKGELVQKDLRKILF